MKPIFLIGCLFVAVMAGAQQLRPELMGGFSPRNAGRVVVGAQLVQTFGQPHAHFGYLVNGVAEIAEGNSLAVAAVAASYDWRFYAGISRFWATNKLLAEGTRNYIMGGIGYVPGRAGVDVRYQGDALYFSFFFSLAKD